MTVSATAPEQVMDFDGPVRNQSRVVILSKNRDLELLRLNLPAGVQLPEHRKPGIVLVQCLKGVVNFLAADRPYRLHAGQLIVLQPNEWHSLTAVHDATLLVTVFRSPQAAAANEAARATSEEQPAEPDPVQEASEESFPASDPPSWIPVTRP